ncbi:fumarylacetoacetate hydrolase family protein [Weeksellaceae bacterium KMM 9713]|uniref:Fumarylacetoacetate hydrolase family protein n=1 Tax=Profundicola chukchiensis TaxID=2961959 RepID=A0A9X4MW15_9FLAO|nr:fumarylacetoacetate hydrolase family protein [Profundicola chukchiensis]MDG4945921.1 fumarylacetoacetate hydrolase family protein [Profundicola chukchiensis]
MKIICIGRNYTEHAKELGNAIPEEPVLFIKPSTSLNTSSSFDIPSFSEDIHFELEIVLKISKTGKNISEEDAQYYFDEISLGIDFTARDVQSKLKEKGLPWEKAKAFDGSTTVSDFVSLNEFKNKEEIEFELYQNEELKQAGNSKNMLFNFHQIIAHASQYFTLEKGDLIFTGTPKGVGKVNSGDVLIGNLEGKKLLEINVK